MRLELALLAALIACIAESTVGHAAILDADPSNYLSQLARIGPGDTLQLASGTYAQGLPLGGMAGTAAQPIVVRGPDDQSAVFTARSCCNTVQLDGTSYVQVLNLTLDGGGLEGPFGVDSRGNCHDITLENLKIIGHSGSQQTVGISAKGPAWNWVIRHNTIIGAGTGIYLGNSDGTDPFVAGVIEYNLVVDTIGYNMEIKQQQPRPTGIGLPAGNSRTIIRYNVFVKRGAVAGSDGARPNVLVGHFPLSGAGTGDLYEIYGNLFYDNPTEALFQGEGNIALYDNLLVNPAGDAVNIQPQEDRPRNVTVFHNTVVASGSGLRITGGDSNFTQRLVANASFAAAPISGPNQQDNVTGSYASASASLGAPYAALGSLDLFPAAGQLTGPIIDVSGFGVFDDGLKDFNGTARTGSHRGAYEGDGANSGWAPALAIQPTRTGSSTPGAAALTFTAAAAQVPLQGSTTLQWSATGATSCTGSDGWSGARDLSGSETVGPLSADTTFTLTCTGAGGSVSRAVTIAVAAAQPSPGDPAAGSGSSSSSAPSSSAGSASGASASSTAAGAAGGGGGLDPSMLGVLALLAWVRLQKFGSSWH